MALDEENKSMLNSDASTDTCRVAFRAPPFFDTEPEIWFAQVEAQFDISGITANKTKYHCVIAALDSKFLTCVVDILRAQPSETSYDVLKQRILDQFSKSESSKLKSLLQDLHLGDRRPSQLLIEMKSLAGSKFDDDLLRSLWMQRLPLSMQQILAVSNEKLEGLAKIADKINEVCEHTAQVHTIDNSGLNLQSLKNDIESLKLEINRISEAVSAIQVYISRRERSQSRERANGNKSKCESKIGLCYFHKRFGENAYTCKKPCSFSKNA